MKQNGFIIPLAWPETKVIFEGKWYDFLMRWFGFLKDNYYTAGHAAFVLVNKTENKFLYYDFGRYHTPLKHGRVRNLETDPELKIKVRPLIDKNGKLINIHALLFELQSNKSCHGECALLASIYYNIDFSKALTMSNRMQNKGTIPYGPLNIGGTNCSRFVNQVTKFATLSWMKKIFLTIPYTISATPKFNIRLINSQKTYYKTLKPSHSDTIKFSIQKVW